MLLACKDTTKIAYMQIFYDFFVYVIFFSYLCGVFEYE